MGTSLILVLSEEQQTNERIIDKYYNYIASKEREYHPERAQEGLKANYEREIARDSLEEFGTVLLQEKIISDIFYISDINLRDLFNSYYRPADEDTVLYGEDIEQLIYRLQESKKQLQQQGEEERWGKIFELKLIALCEFALKNGYGIKLG